MSYLYAPRLTFAGQFQADVSTVNNDPEHFDSGTFQPNYELLTTPNSPNGWWNPRGTGAWRFFGCKVQQVCYRDGTSSDDPNVDPVVGAAINGSDVRVEGKLVDLDPEQQMVSEIWGFQIVLQRFQSAGMGSKPLGFRSDFEVSAFADIWNRFPAGQPDQIFGAFYQSVLNAVEWKGDGGSRFLQELCVGGVAPDQLSIKFNVDGIDQNVSSPTFTFGRVVGTIGLCSANEPKRFIAGKVLQPVPQSPLNTAYAIVRDNRLWLDLGNSLPTQSAGGPNLPEGSLYAAIFPSSGAPVLLGEIEYLSGNWYNSTAGVVSFPLSADHVKLATANPVAVVLSSPNGPQPLLLESPTFVRADKFVFRFNPPEKQDAEFWATSLGNPAANQPMAFGYDPSFMEGQATQGPVPGPQTVGLPQSALQFPSTVNTDENGHATLTMTSADPGNPRVYIDGQVYGITYSLGSSPPPVGSVQNPSLMLSALVFSGYQGPSEPTWLESVQPIFQQYANLYPIMRPIVDLASFASVMSCRHVLERVFDTPIDNPNYMPVTRDLSAGKRQMIRQWLANPVYMRLDSKEDLMQALQIAVELEHATIPPYLTALYSIKEGTNVEVADLIRSVVVEEMLHMALSSNILISIGGAPDIAKPGFVPRYPGTLPGGLRGGLIVRLRRCSIAQVRDVFMSIEEPEETVDPVRRQSHSRDQAAAHSFTIGWFYSEIEKALTNLTESGEISFGHADRQVSDWSGPGNLIVIQSLPAAIAAIREIKEQGEGAGPLDPDDPQHELAHFYRFSEIVEGRALVFHKETKSFAYTGARIPFDPESVWPMVDDPDMVMYPPGSRALILVEQFSRTYQALLKGLHRTFNGEPQYLREAIGLMYSLDLAARELMRTPSGLKDGTTAGPTFQLTGPGMV
jgi:hypothetical protein